MCQSALSKSSFFLISSVFILQIVLLRGFCVGQIRCLVGKCYLRLWWQEINLYMDCGFIWLLSLVREKLICLFCPPRMSPPASRCVHTPQSRESFPKHIYLFLQFLPGGHVETQFLILGLFCFGLPLASPASQLLDFGVREIALSQSPASDSLLYYSPSRACV